MTIDERLDRLTERHEALTQSVEMMSKDIGVLKTIAEVGLDSIRRLERIAISHEVRIEDVEARLNRLEEGAPE